MLEVLIQIVHVVVALFMILVVLIQGGNQGGIGAAFGGGNSSGVFGATGATTFLGKLTYGAASVFMITSISLTVLQGQAGDVGLREKLERGQAPTPAAETPASGQPAAETTPASGQPAAETPAPAQPGPGAEATP